MIIYLQPLYQSHYYMFQREQPTTTAVNDFPSIASKKKNKRYQVHAIQLSSTENLISARLPEILHTAK